MGDKTYKLIIDGKSVNVPESQVMEKLYYDLATISKFKDAKEEMAEKIRISKIKNWVPLFDIATKNIYLVSPHFVYDMITKNNYRFPSEKIYKLLVDTFNSIKNKKKQSKLDELFLKKLTNNITFLNNFDLETLENTYIKIFYYYSNKVGKNITPCFKPSYLPYTHSNPYYTRSELINLALNMGLIKRDETYYDENKIYDICDVVSKNDIDKKTLLLHQLFIQDNSYKYFIQYYSLLGSFYINKYIRDKNVFDPNLEKLIRNFGKVVQSAPEFDRDYYLYRFLSDDSFLTHLKIGDIYYDYSFLSTSRNPFYDITQPKFGFILLKINIPKGKRGIGICMESYSHFPDEEEIILSPGKLKLKSIDDNFTYYHPNEVAQNAIQKKYEFDYIDVLTDFIPEHEKQLSETLEINFETLKLQGSDIKNKIYEFYKNILIPTNKIRRFETKIGDKKHIIETYYLDENKYYEKYFFLQKKENVVKEYGDEIYFIIQNYDTGEISLVIELRNIISVNYYHKYSSSGKEIISDKDLIEFLSQIGMCFGINEIIIHPKYHSYLSLYDNNKEILNSLEYTNPDTHQINLLSADFNYWNFDVINYLEKGDKRFEDVMGVESKFLYFQFDKLFKTKISAVLNKTDKDELYKVGNKFIEISKQDDCGNFFIYLHYHHFYYIDLFVKKLSILYPKGNPFESMYYVLNTSDYLQYYKKIFNYNLAKLSSIDFYLDKLKVDVLENANIYRKAKTID